MNRTRRKEIDDIIRQLLDVETTVQLLKEQIEEVAISEQEAADNLPEGLRDSESGQAMDNSVALLESAALDLDTMYFDNVVAQLEEAKGGAA